MRAAFWVGCAALLLSACSSEPVQQATAAHVSPVKRDTENAKTGQRKYEKTIFRILCVKPPISGGFLSMFKSLLKSLESSLQSIS